jgi:hypothetical protein
MPLHFWTTLVPLLTAHLLADFVFQTDEDVARKHRPGILLKHVLIVTASSYVLLGRPDAWLPIVVIFSTHLIIDYLKIRIGRDNLTAFTVDQVAHLLVIAALAAAPAIGSTSSLWESLFGNGYYILLVFASGVIVVIGVGAVVVGKAVDPFLLQMRSTHQESKERPIPRHGFEQGGRLIGQLERALILLFVLANQLSAVGFLIAAKSILRIGEVKDRSHRMEAEYIIIGTLVSFLWGLAAAFATQWMLGRVL